jgi:uncharacterized protein YqfA (UPF0365 family)
MTRKKREPSMDMADLNVGEAIARLLQTDPAELDETLANSVLEREAKIRQRVKDAREEIDDGGRPRRGRFRL